MAHGTFILRNKNVPKITKRLVDIGNEAFALYLRRWLAVTAASSDTETAAARAEVEKRFAFFIEALARRLETGRLLHDELVRREEIAWQAPGRGTPEAE